MSQENKINEIINSLNFFKNKKVSNLELYSNSQILLQYNNSSKENIPNKMKNVDKKKLFSIDRVKNSQLINSKTIDWNFFQEIFEIRHFAFDVDMAKKLLQEQSKFSSFFEMSPEDIEFIQNEIEVDENTRAPLDLSIPIIMVHIRPQALIPIDGYHRLLQLIANNQKTVECFILDFEESQKIRIHPNSAKSAHKPRL